MLSGVLTATICNTDGPIFQHLHSFSDEMDLNVYLPNKTSVIVSSVLGSLILAAGIIRLLMTRGQESATENEKLELENNKRKLLPAIASAFLFSIGLVISEMTVFSKIYGFLNMNLIPAGTWDPTLLMVMGGGFTVSFISYQWVQGFNLFKVRAYCYFAIFFFLVAYRISHPILYLTPELSRHRLPPVPKR